MQATLTFIDKNFHPTIFVTAHDGERYHHKTLNCYGLTVPNTLIHIGLQLPASRALCKSIELPWLVAGCIIPDIPWIAQRLLLYLPFFDPYAIRAYATIQASLFFCLLLSAALAFFSKKRLPLFLLLAGNSLLHLGLDALQIKWANGVHFFAPLSWQQFRFDLLWPEHVASYPLSLLGVLVLLLFWKKESQLTAPLHLPSRRRTLLPTLLFILYILLPLVLLDQPVQADNAYTKTLTERTSRPGKYIEIDRATYSAATQSIRLLSGELIGLEGALPSTDSSLSIRGHFLSTGLIGVESYHVHTNFRNSASYLGLFLAVGVWIHSLLIQFHQKSAHGTHSYE